ARGDIGRVRPLRAPVVASHRSVGAARELRLQLFGGEARQQLGAADLDGGGGQVVVLRQGVGHQAVQPLVAEGGPPVALRLPGGGGVRGGVRKGGRQRRPRRR